MIRVCWVWILRRRRDQLSDRVDWLRDMVWSGQDALERAEKALRAAQAEVWAAETPRKLLQPRGADSRTKTGEI